MTYYTHAGLFHCDEVTGYAICELAGVCDNFKRLNLRGEELEQFLSYRTGVVSDIGRVYDPARRKFDHHQGMLRRSNGYPLASAGLLWKEFGIYAVFNVLGGAERPDFFEKVVERVDLTLIQGIDAHDSDNEYSIDSKCSAGEVRIFTLPNLVSTYNHHDVFDSDVQDESFHDAVSLVSKLIRSEIKSAANYIKSAEKFEQCSEITGRVLILSESLPWKEIVHEKYPDIDFVIAPSNHPGNSYSMIAVAATPYSREVKVPIERLGDFTGFIHEGKWIAGSDSIESLRELAELNILNNQTI